MGECSEDAELAAQLVVGRVVVVAFIRFPLGIATFFITERGIYHMMFPVVTFLCQQDLHLMYLWISLLLLDLPL